MLILSKLKSNYRLSSFQLFIKKYLNIIGFSQSIHSIVKRIFSNNHYYDVKNWFLFWVHGRYKKIIRDLKRFNCAYVPM